ncbi:hypothetical protein BDP27DRAFT_1316748 [Rhodocollybia butyracea]|uniref:Glycan binding protein Y3-like domain-containing protein n=1 Tax=Rhodocollybia butyracea TaxID=206335 RepID=A0A9P5Q4Q3_9AGAR|nr:hypothetical protein BDP27DRAFT_1316748 [Rhodocollybia butyracea]
MLTQANYHNKLGFVAAVSLALAAMPVLGQTFSCITTGVDPGSCSQFIPSFCNSGNLVAGNSLTPVEEQDTISRCYNAPGLGYKCDFTTWNEFGTGNLPAPDGCESVLDLISENCPMGGQGTAGGFASFQMIPNEGSCNFNG